MTWTYNDGGRASSGFKGNASGDCVTRAIAIATNRPYKQVYEALKAMAKMTDPQVTRGYCQRWSPKTGIPHTVWKPILRALNWEPVTVRERFSDITFPSRAILQLPRHLAAVIDGQVEDTFDCTCQGTIWVTEYWQARPDASERRTRSA
jgi:hypothetical protein